MSTVDAKQKAIGTRIRDEILNKYGSIQSFCDATGQKYRTIQDWCSGKRRPRGAGLATLAAQLNTTVEALQTGHGAGYVYVPRYNISVGAGPGRKISSERIVDWLAFRDVWITRMHLSPRKGDLVLFDVQGDSMKPTIVKNDLVLLDCRVNSVKEPGIYVYASGDEKDELAVKRMEKITGSLTGEIRIRPDNQDDYEDATLTAEQMKKIKIVGRVAWFGRSL